MIKCALKMLVQHIRNRLMSARVILLSHFRTLWSYLSNKVDKTIVAWSDCADNQKFSKI